MEATGGSANIGRASTPPWNSRWMPVALLGGVAVLAGLILPQLLPSAAPPAAHKSTESPSPSPLTYTPPTWPEPPNHQAMFLRLFVGTLAVLGLCAGTLWFCRRWMQPGGAPRPHNAQLRLVETLSLGQRCLVHLVQVANRPVLIGVDGSGVKTLVPLPENFAQALLEAEAAPADLESGVGGLTGPAPLTAPELGRRYAMSQTEI